MKKFLLPILVIGAILMTGCKNKTESNDSAVTVVVVDSQSPSMYQNADTIAFIKQNLMQALNINPANVEEIKLYFGTEGSRMSMLHDVKCDMNGARYNRDELRRHWYDMSISNNSSAEAQYMNRLEGVLQCLINGQERIADILQGDYGKWNFYYELKLDPSKSGIVGTDPTTGQQSQHEEWGANDGWYHSEKRQYKQDFNLIEGSGIIASGICTDGNGKQLWDVNKINR